MSAQFVDALKGYEYFLSVRGHASRIQINKYLESIDRKPIAARTYSHYEKLLDNGFRSYVPINKFDVFQALGRLQMAADRRRYERHLVDQAAAISRDQQSWNACTIIDRSLVGFGIMTAGKFPVSRGTQLWVQLEDYLPIPVVVVWRQHLGAQTRIGSRAFEFIAKYRIVEPPTEPRKARSLRILRLQEGDLYWQNLFRVLEKTDELLVATEDLMLSIDALINSGIRPLQPTLKNINFASPGEAQIKIDFGIAEILKVLFEKIQFWRDQKRKFRAEADIAELEKDNLAIEVARNAIHLGKEAEEAGLPHDVVAGLLAGPLQRAFGVDQLPPHLFGDGSPEVAIVDQRLLPAATDLLAGDDLDFDFKVDDEDEE